MSYACSKVTRGVLNLCSLLGSPRTFHRNQKKATSPCHSLLLITAGPEMYSIWYSQVVSRQGHLHFGSMTLFLSRPHEIWVSWPSLLVCNEGYSLRKFNSRVRLSYAFGNNVIATHNLGSSTNPYGSQRFTGVAIHGIIWLFRS